MKSRILYFFTLALLLSACNMTLAEDITPPPGYVHPTPVPTLVLYPSQKPSVANGERIYAEKCAACHGDTGLGDGEQGIQLGVTVRAFGLAEVARPASPAQYYTAVTRGNIERFMPPFASLSDQERWDVVAYALTMHTTPEQIERGLADEYWRVRIAWAHRMDYTPTTEQIERGLTDRDWSVRVSWQQRLDFEREKARLEALKQEREKETEEMLGDIVEF